MRLVKLLIEFHFRQHGHFNFIFTLHTYVTRPHGFEKGNNALFINTNNSRLFVTVLTVHTNYDCAHIVMPRTQRAVLYDLLMTKLHCLHFTRFRTMGIMALLFCSCRGRQLFLWCFTSVKAASLLSSYF